MTDRPGRTRKHALRIGTAGWNVPSQHADAFKAEGSHLERYASVLNCTEINTSFYRPHRRTTYERWSAAVPAGFRFAVKVPQSISHAPELRFDRADVDRFCEEISGLGQKLGVLLLQLPSSTIFARRGAGKLVIALQKGGRCRWFASHGTRAGSPGRPTTGWRNEASRGWPRIHRVPPMALRPAAGPGWPIFGFTVHRGSIIPAMTRLPWRRSRCGWPDARRPRSGAFSTTPLRAQPWPMPASWLKPDSARPFARGLLRESL
ncbi:hypothetical protein ABIA06_000616 [Bradyrhizobium yuanmingense]